MAVRARPDAPPVRPRPVGDVVAAPGLLRARPVAHLVPPEPRGGEQLVGELVLVGLVVVLRRGHDPAAHLGRELGAVLDDERVGRDVVGLEGDGGLEAAAPVLERLPRRAVDEIDADLHPGGLAWRRRLARRCRGRACARASRSTCGTADCIPTETRVKPPAASSRSESGVTESGLASVVTSASGASPNRVAYAVQHRHEVGGPQHRGSATTDEHRRHRGRFVAQHRTGEVELTQGRIGVGVDRRCSRPGRRARSACRC